MARPRQPLELSNETRQEVEAWANSLSLSHSLVRRAKIILLSADGMSNS